MPPPRHAQTIKIPRPPNAFLLYRSDMGPRLPPPLPPATSRSQSEISQMVAKLWHNETLEVRAEFKRRAVERKMEHGDRYPGYVYRPRRKAEVEVEVNVAKQARRMKGCDGSGRYGAISTESHSDFASQVTSTSTAGSQSTSHTSYHEAPQHHPSFDPVPVPASGGEVLDLNICPELSYYAFEQALRDVFGNPDNHIEFYTTTTTRDASSPYASDRQLGGGSSDVPSWDSGYAPAAGGVVAVACHGGFKDCYYDSDGESGGRDMF